MTCLKTRKRLYFQNTITLNKVFKEFSQVLHKFLQSFQKFIQSAHVAFNQKGTNCFFIQNFIKIKWNYPLYFYNMEKLTLQMLYYNILQYIVEVILTKQLPSIQILDDEQLRINPFATIDISFIHHIILGFWIS